MYQVSSCYEFIPRFDLYFTLLTWINSLAVEKLQTELVRTIFPAEIKITHQTYRRWSYAFGKEYLLRILAEWIVSQSSIEV